MSEPAKLAIESVLSSGPSRLLKDRGFSKRRLHFRRCDEGIWKLLTFEVDRFHDGDPVVAFGGMVSPNVETRPCGNV
jgi:hypothetical protein